MPDYEKMYFQLTAKVADAVDLLVKSQQRGESEYIEDKNKALTNTFADTKCKSNKNDNCK